MSRGRKFPIFGIIVGILFLLVAAVAIWRSSVTSANSKQLRAIAARGEPTTLAELDKFYRAVPDSNNAALLWLRGAAALTNDLGNIAGKVNPRRGVSVPENLLQEIAEALATNADALALFHRAARLDQSRYPVSLSQQPLTNLHHLAKLKGAAQVLRAEAAVALSQTNTALAAEATTAIFGAGRSMMSEPIMISQLVAYAIDAIGVQTLQFALNTASFDEHDLAMMQSAVAKADDPESAARGLLGERAFFISGLSDPSRFIAGMRLGPPSGIEEIVSEVFVQPIAQLSGFWQRDLRFGINALTAHLESARLSDPQRFHATTNIDATAQRARTGYYIMSGMVLPAMAKYLQRDTNHRAQLRTSLSGIAVERFRLAHNGKLPEDLSSLVPNFLDKIPFDPFDGQPLRYKRTANGFVVYSIGPDEKDDGAIEPPPGPKPKSLWDVTFIVERPQPANE